MTNVHVFSCYLLVLLLTILGKVSAVHVHVVVTFISRVLIELWHVSGIFLLLHHF